MDIQMEWYLVGSLVDLSAMRLVKQMAGTMAELLDIPMGTLTGKSLGNLKG